MIETYLAMAFIGIVAYLATAYLVLVTIPKRAAPNRKLAVKLVSVIVLGAILVVGVSWAPSVTSAAKTESNQLFAAYCAMSGDEIRRTVSNVDGFLIQPPPGSANRGSHFHRNETSHYSHVFPPKRNYTFVEIGNNKPGGGVLRYEHPVENGRSTEQDAPSARYALTWVDLTQIQEGNAGLFGEQVFVYDRLTKEILARRTHYYLVTRGGSTTRSESIRSCPQVDIGVDEAYKDRRPRSSYNFVSKVLLPSADTDMSVALESEFPCDPNAEDGQIFNPDGSIGNRDSSVEQYLVRRSNYGNVQCWKLGVAPKNPPVPRTPPAPTFTIPPADRIDD